MGLKVAINGFGRIGRISLRALLKKPGIEVVAINDLSDGRILAHLFKYDSAHGIFNGHVEYDNGYLIINDKKIKMLTERDPEKLPWVFYGVELVLESTGQFRKKEKAALHLAAGAKKVIISAVAKGDSKKEIKTIVLGVNDDILMIGDEIISNASCTTNCLAILLKVLDDNWGVEKGFMTTVHAYTSNQNLQDGPQKDLRRARAAAQNIVPSTTGAAKTIGLIIPHLDGKIDGMAMRVPVITGSIADLTCVMKKRPGIEEINMAFKNEAGNKLKGVLEYSEAELVSTDIIGNVHSCVFDAPSTMVLDNMVKVVGWYDNEAGYSQRIADLIEKSGKL